VSSIPGTPYQLGLLQIRYYVFRIPLRDLFSVLQFKSKPLVKDSRFVVVARDSESRWPTACFAIRFVVEFECDLHVPVAQLDRAAAF
jgi:hypothetical protein